MTPEEKLQSLGLALPPYSKPQGVYRPAVVVGNLLYTSGHGPVRADKTAITGRLGADLDVAAGYEAARVTGVNLLGTVHAELGGLSRVARLIKVLGLVQATPEFTQHPAVINGFSELLRDVFGEQIGLGARSAFGAVSLPLGWAVEIEAIFEVR